MPPASSHRRGGGLPWRGSRVTVLETNAAKGKRSSSASPNTRRAAIASNVPEPLTTGCASSMPQNSITGGRSSDRLQLRGVEHGPVDAQPHVARPGRHDAAEAGAEAAGHPGLERELSRDALLGAHGADRLEHGRRAAGVDLGARVTAELGAQQLRHEPAVPARA